METRTDLRQGTKTNNSKILRVLCVIFSVIVLSAALEAQSDVVNTKHNLSVTGPGPIKATTEDRICIFCHTPHNATPSTPLWNKEIEPRAYNLYTSVTLKAPMSQPTGPTRLCLSCHDGTIAMGTVVNPAGGINMAGSGTFPPGSLSDFGLDLSGHHPVSFSYSSVPNPELAGTPPSDLVFGGVDEIHCTTCHDPHSDKYEKFLAKDNRYSALCISCHEIPGWDTSLHATSTAPVTGILPRPPKTWPAYTQMDEWGCETCHTPHFAPTPEQLLNFTALPPDPFSCTSAGCHSSDPGPPHNPLVPGSAGAARPAGGMADIAGQILKVSAHHEQPFALSRPSGPFRSREAFTGVTCADCHNPHEVTELKAAAPYVSGMLRGVSGVDRNGMPIPAANYEYEVCFKCHADYTNDNAFVPRVVSNTNTRLAFDPENPSYHPVISMGRNLDIPSIPSNLAPSMNASNILYCSSCHADDEDVSNGPHGSQYAPILKERYETADNTPENFENFALCYRCHDRTSILNDSSFKKKIGGETGGGHSGHLQNGAPCSACHDPHGVSSTAANGLAETGSHTHLINFDTQIVLPLPGNPFPVFNDSGQFSGSCTLVCHGKLHDHLSYP